MYDEMFQPKMGRQGKDEFSIRLSPEHISFFEELQDSRDHKRHHASGEMVPTLKSLDHILKNPHVNDHIHKATRQYYAKGGHVQPNAENGRFGDTQLAYGGPHLLKLLHEYAGHKQLNPIDNAPEFFSLAPLMRGIGSFFAPMMQYPSSLYRSVMGGGKGYEGRMHPDNAMGSLNGGRESLTDAQLRGLGPIEGMRGNNGEAPRRQVPPNMVRGFRPQDGQSFANFMQRPTPSQQPRGIQDGLYSPHPRGAMPTPGPDMTARTFMNEAFAGNDYGVKAVPQTQTYMPQTQVKRPVNQDEGYFSQMLHPLR